MARYSIVATSALVDDAQMEAWAAELDSWDVCDGLMSTLFRRAALAWNKAQLSEKSVVVIWYAI